MRENLSEDENSVMPEAPQKGVSQKDSAPKTDQQPYFNSKSVAFVAIMGAMGVVLAYFSNYFKISAGPGVNVSVDLSHVGTYLVAIAAGPILGMCTGAIVGLVPAFQYYNPALVPGKMMTGFLVGFVYSVLRRQPKVQDSKPLRICAITIAGLVGYIPEYIFTIWDMRIIVGIPDLYIWPVMIKAPIEIMVITTIATLLFNNTPIRNEIGKIISEEPQFKKPEFGGLAILVGVTSLFVIWLFAQQTIIADYLWVTTWGWVAFYGGASLVFAAAFLYLTKKS